MTSLLHLVFRSIAGQNPELLLGDFKSFTSRTIVKAIEENPRESRRAFLLTYFKKEAAKTSNTTNNQFWHHDNKPIELWSNEVIQQKIDYKHNNLVEEGFVFIPEIINKLACMILQYKKEFLKVVILQPFKP